MKKIFYPLISSIFVLSCSNQPNITNTVSQAQTTTVKKSQPKITLNEIEQVTLDELNLLRKSPKEYADKVEDSKKYYNGDYIQYPGEIKIITSEGMKAVDECITVLKNTESLPEFKLSKGLTLAAQNMVEMQSKTSETGHTGTDGSSPFDRMNKFGTWDYSAAENIDYGNNVPLRIVMSLIIDDGVSSRGHRKNILSADYKEIGLAGGVHQGYRHMFVMDFAGKYTEK